MSSQLSSSSTLSPTSNRYCIVVIGAGGVGKSALSIQYVQGVFVNVYDPTIMDSLLKTDSVDGRNVVVTVVDTAGQGEYTDQRAPYIRTADMCVFVYSITDQHSFAQLPSMVDHAIKCRTTLSNPKFPFLVVGNKLDLSEHRTVTEDQGRRMTITLAGRLGLSPEEMAAIQRCPPFCEVTATVQNDATEVFHNCVRLVQKMRCGAGFHGMEECNPSAPSRTSAESSRADSEAELSLSNVGLDGSSLKSSGSAIPPLTLRERNSTSVGSGDEKPILILPEDIFRASGSTTSSPLEPAKKYAVGGGTEGKKKKEKKVKKGMRCQML